MRHCVQMGDNNLMKYMKNMKFLGLYTSYIDLSLFFRLKNMSIISTKNCTSEDYCADNLNYLHFLSPKLAPNSVSNRTILCRPQLAPQSKQCIQLVVVYSFWFQFIFLSFLVINTQWLAVVATKKTAVSSPKFYRTNGPRERIAVVL